MCTLTLIPEDQGYTLTMNRDELKTREEAGLKKVQKGAVTAGFPVDAAAGGTWVGFNNRGVSLALLNRYQAPSISGAQSRGNIIAKAIVEGDAGDTLSHLKSLDVERYNPFNLLLVDGQQVVQFHWDREKYYWDSHGLTHSLMLTSSSERLTEVSEFRQTQFAQWLNKPSGEAAIDQYHLSQEPGRAADAVMMSRTLVHTKSIVQIRVGSQSARLNYFDTPALQANQARLGSPSTAAEIRLAPCDEPVAALA